MKNTENKTNGESVKEEIVQYEELQIFPDALKYKTKLTKKFRDRKPWRRPDPQEIFSIIPGTVSEIRVKVSDHVEKGDQLMEYEAMKMENIIRAPFAGTVDKILVKEGEKLAKGVLMIYLKSDTAFADDATSNVQDPIG